MCRVPLAPAQTVEAVLRFRGTTNGKWRFQGSDEKNLMEQGLDAETAATVVKDVKQAKQGLAGGGREEHGLRRHGLHRGRRRDGADLRDGILRIGWRPLCCIAWGAIVFGGIQCFRGMIQAAMNLL